MAVAESISVIIPACNSACLLARCLEALERSAWRPHEVIVIDDSSKDQTAFVAEAFQTTVLATQTRSGPAYARNLGARAASGSILFFLDSDVCVRADTLQRIAAHFNDPRLDALIGSYDPWPDSQDFISQYRNLMHSYVHQKGSREASTFWSGCGAIRRELFLEHSGFDAAYGRPAIEDIELGYRLIRAGCKIVLDADLQVTHLKRWTFMGLVKTDVLDRGIPWTELILRDRFMPNDLNLQLSQRVSVALVFLLVFLSAAIAYFDGIYLLLPAFALLFLMLSGWWGEVGATRPLNSSWILVLGTMVLISALAYSRKMYGLIPPLAISPVLLLLRHRYHRRVAVGGQIPRFLGIAFIIAAVGAAAYHLAAQPLIFAFVAVLAILGLLNSQFYIFLAGKRGMLFMLAAVPFHLLYHFYNGISFLIGTTRYYWTARKVQKAPAYPPTEP